MNNYEMMGGWTMMGSWGTSHWLMFIIIITSVLYPVGLILRKLGYSPFLAVFACIPLVNLIGLWVVALSSSEIRNDKTTDKAAET